MVEATGTDSGPLSASEAADLIFKREEDGSPQVIDSTVEDEGEQDRSPEKPQPASLSEDTDDDTADSDSDAEAGSDEIKDEESDSEDEDDLSPIDIPRTLPKEKREIFRSMPREVQERWAEIEEQSSRELRRLQSEADKKRRASDAELDAVREAKQQYENALPQVLSLMGNSFQTEFPDIRTQEDVTRLAAQDPARYVKFDALAKQYTQVQEEQQAATQHYQTETMQRWDAYSTEQDANFVERFPEWNDSEKGPKLQRTAVNMLEDVGFSQEEVVNAFVHGQAISFRDSRIQTLIARLVHFEAKDRRAQSALAKAKTKPSQSVTRPGVATDKGEQSSAHAEELRQRLHKTGKVEDAVALIANRL
jgi:hypothetical protein